jgi:electron transfer flavoprotein alpha subunit
VSFELLSKGRKLAAELDGSLVAVVIGHQLDSVVREAFSYGAQEVLRIDHPALADYRTAPYSRLLTELVTERQPRVVLFGASFIGRDLAPRVASHTRSGLTADCTDLQVSDVTYMSKDYEKLLLQIRPAFGGNIIATIITPDAPIQMATVREGVMELSALSPAAEGKASATEGKVTTIDYQPQPVDELIEIIERHQEESRINLKGASIVVSGGYGMGSKEGFACLHELAALVGGEVAGSRAAVDAGFADGDRQVGQTGVTVRPKLYLACGISGAIQHVAGMQDSNRIIAINTDSQAPIFDVCHYGIVGDVHEVIPTFITVYKERLR